MLTVTHMCAPLPGQMAVFAGSRSLAGCLASKSPWSNAARITVFMDYLRRCVKIGVFPADESGSAEEEHRMSKLKLLRLNKTTGGDI